MIVNIREACLFIIVDTEKGFIAVYENNVKNMLEWSVISQNFKAF